MFILDNRNRAKTFIFKTIRTGNETIKTLKFQSLIHNVFTVDESSNIIICVI